MGRRFPLIILLVLVLQWLAAPQAGAADRPPVWTIMIYGNGDNNLAPSLVADIKKMETTGSAAGFNMVVQADFDASQLEDLVEDGLPKELAPATTRFLVKASTNPEKVTSAPVQRLPELNHDDPKVLSDFIVWAARKYPANRYALILWDHGGQWEGYGGDTQDGTLDDPGSLSTAQIAGAIQAAMKTASIPKWEFIAFDTCLMGGAEVLGDFASITGVFIACPEIDFGDGWNYGASFAWLKSHPAAGTLDFARQEAECWKTLHFKDDNPADQILAAHSVFDLRKYPTFERVFAEFASTLARLATPKNLDIPILRRKSHEYSIPCVMDLGNPTEYVDLGEFAGKLAQSPKIDASLRDVSRRLLVSVDDLVAAKVIGSCRKDCRGLSVWYPVNGWGELHEADEEEESGEDGEEDNAGSPARKDPSPDAEAREKFQHYQQISMARRTPWGQFLTRIHENFLLDKNEPPEIEGLPSQTAENLSASVRAPLRIPVRIGKGNGAIGITSMVIGNHMTKNPRIHVFLGEISETEAGGPGQYEVRWDSRLPVVAVNNGTKTIFMGGAYLQGSGLFVSYAKHFPKNSKRGDDVILITQFEGEKGRIVDVLDAGDGNSAPSSMEVDPGDSFRLVYQAQRRKGNNPGKWTDFQLTAKERIVVPPKGVKDIPVLFQPAPPGSYCVDIMATDVYNNGSNVLEYPVLVGSQP
ncbi:MAG: clostripain-related cysteine peptidase [Verrucomicrobiae bacterium]|nr:clostripain-related cysteine peptidase [Verrucomicrobiae bacterium]